MFNKLLSYISQDIAIDLGTANSLVYVRGEGIVVNEPSVVAINQKTGQILAFGEEAKKMVGRTPSHIIAIRPLVEGVISDFEITEQMLRYFIEKTRKGKFILAPRPRVIIAVPCGLTEVERKAVSDAAKNAGAGHVFLIEQPMAAAIGARLSIQEPGGNFIIDIGGGTTEIALISLGGIVLSYSLKIAGNKFNQDIIRFAEEQYKLLVGERTAEIIKINIGSVYPLKQKLEAPIKGRNIITGLPEEIIIGEEEISHAIKDSIKQIINVIKTAIEKTPPELLADIMSKGIYLAGGGSLLRGLDILISKETKIQTKVVDDPLTAVVRGAGIVIENIDTLKEVILEEENLEPPK